MKKIAYLCILSLFLTLACTACGKKNTEMENPFEDPANYYSGLHYVQMYVYGYGNIFMVLDADAAPATVTNFLALVDAGFYDGLTFHRVVDGYMIQGGDPKADGTGKSGFTVPGEFAANGHENPLSHVRGTVSLARNEKDYNSGSCQFFIVQEDSTKLDGEYAAFGTVVHGMDVVDKICENTPVKNKNGMVDYKYQPLILAAFVLSEEEFKYLEQYDFNPPEEEEKDDESGYYLPLTMEMSAPDHGKTVIDSWLLNEAAETYLLSSTDDLTEVGIYAITDITTLTYDKEKPLASYKNLKAEELIEVRLLVPETIPAHFLILKDKDGVLYRYYIMYNGKDGGVMLVPVPEY